MPPSLSVSTRFHLNFALSQNSLGKFLRLKKQSTRSFHFLSVGFLSTFFFFLTHALASCRQCLFFATTVKTIPTRARIARKSTPSCTQFCFFVEERKRATPMHLILFFSNRTRTQLTNHRHWSRSSSLRRRTPDCWRSWRRCWPLGIASVRPGRSFPRPFSAFGRR